MFGRSFRLFEQGRLDGGLTMNLKAWAFLAAAMIVFAWATSPVRAISEDKLAEAEPAATLSQ
jgi:hypothetical protein